MISVRFDLTCLPRLTKPTSFRIQVRSSRPCGHVRSSRWWSDHVQVFRREEAPEDLAHPIGFDSDGQRYLIVGKVGNTTDLTVGRYAGLVSFTQNEVGIESVELGIYNSGDKTVEVFSAKGDSGSLL